VCLDHVGSFIVNANHGIMRTAVKLGKADGVADCVWPGVPQWTVWQHIGDKIAAAFSFARAGPELGNLRMAGESSDVALVLATPGSGTCR
jgi:hypothetical protein